MPDDRSIGFLRQPAPTNQTALPCLCLPWPTPFTSVNQQLTQTLATPLLLTQLCPQPAVHLFAINYKLQEQNKKEEKKRCVWGRACIQKKNCALIILINECYNDHNVCPLWRDHWMTLPHLDVPELGGNEPWQQQRGTRCDDSQAGEKYREWYLSMWNVDESWEGISVAISSLFQCLPCFVANEKMHVISWRKRHTHGVPSCSHGWIHIHRLLNTHWRWRAYSLTRQHVNDHIVPLCIHTPLHVST